MKNLALIIFILCFSYSIASAQWTVQGANTIYTATGNVGLGTSTPTEKLD